jgi:hypothetical protein
LLSLAVFAVVAISAPAQAARTLRPTVNSFYARDEGEKIHFALKFCEQNPNVGEADKYVATFRMWSGKGKLLIKRPVTPIVDGRCGTAKLLLGDRFAPGSYWANVEIKNLNNKGFSRIKARALELSDAPATT